MDTALGGLRLGDRIPICDALARYVRGVDRRDWDLVRSAYHTDAYDDHGDYKGDIEGFIAMVQERHALMEQSLHAILSSTIEFSDNNEALVESSFVVFQRFGPNAGELRKRYVPTARFDDANAVEIEVVGRYIDLFKKRNADWRIAERRVVVEQSRAAAVPVQPTAGWAQPRRDGLDPVEVMRRRLRFPSSGPGLST
jgi:hypothetical protein